MGMIEDPIFQQKTRTVLANERTFAAWIRTGLAFLAVGIAAHEFFRDVWYGFIIPGVSILFVLCGSLCFAFSTVHYWHLESRIRSTQVKGVPHYLLFIVSTSLVLMSLLVLAVILIEISLQNGQST